MVTASNEVHLERVALVRIAKMLICRNPEIEEALNLTDAYFNAIGAKVARVDSPKELFDFIEMCLEYKNGRYIIVTEKKKLRRVE